MFALPDLGEGLTEAEIVAWRVDEGATVELNQPLVEVETAKATVEVPAPYAGVVERRHADVGATVAVGAPLVTIRTAATAPQPAAPPAPVSAATEEPSGAVLVGYGTSGAAPARRRRAVVAVPAAASHGEPARTTARAAARTSGNSAPPADLSAVAKPPVRRLARSLGVDVADLSTDGGPVTRSAVLAAAVSGKDGDGVTRVPLRGVRRTIAERMTRSRSEVPEATTWVEADVTDLWQLRQRLNATGGIPVSPLVLVLRVVVAALRRFPVLNSRFDAEAQEIATYRPIHLGVATSTPRGLMVPCIRDADTLTVDGLAAALSTLTERARAGTLSPGDLTGGTFTVNNYGVFGVDGGDPIINAPEVGILGVGRMLPRPWVHEGSLAVRRTTQLTLSFDHRVCDGLEAGGFLRYVADLLESPTDLFREL
ncbi:dihydrolipoamide acetyltransferase family protein [Dactylosporangium sp. AC04546]|uniref:dihydrolipoamide acetyltransferase family protein n=1 Tax=Dactylosporangium sp. AC04546 TaxID=2862460 RepID=UPI001EE11D47|nr:dihydrolipoamide acetyltransferase family protein [Dactylosporangium sp. AC04546]WVK88998.1 dihydrolipoamide acetyltransferase family protein [Dactylosporangium sp. AC04546]